MTDYRSILDAIVSDSRYQSNLDWGQPRHGHPEGTVRAHIKELEQNLRSLKHKLTTQEYDKLRVLIHTHDTFKAEAKQGTPIIDPRSHASLARAFLSEFCDDEDLLEIVQYHDEPYALWLQLQSKGSYNIHRWEVLLSRIPDWNLFLAFNIIDGCTEGKSGEPVRWLIELAAGQFDSRWNLEDVL